MDINEEILLAKLRKLEDAGVAGAPLPPGYFSEAVEEGGSLKSGVKRYDKSVLRDDGSTRIRTGQGRSGVFWDRAPIVKRTDRARADSMADRMWKAIESHNPGEMVYLLQLVQGENWTKGRPVSFEDVKAAAIEVLKKAAIDAAKREGR